jgi:hypothetical protein
MGNNTKCPDDKIIAGYLNEMLGVDEKSNLERHFKACDLCAQKARKLFLSKTFLDSFKAYPEYGNIFKEKSCIQTSHIKADAASENKSVKKVKTCDGKYELILCQPISKGDPSLLRVIILDNSIKKGRLKIYNSSGFEKSITIHDTSISLLVEDNFVFKGLKIDYMCE